MSVYTKRRTLYIKWVLPSYLNVLNIGIPNKLRTLAHFNINNVAIAIETDLNNTVFDIQNASTIKTQRLGLEKLQSIQSHTRFLCIYHFYIVFFLLEIVLCSNCDCGALKHNLTTWWSSEIVVFLLHHTHKTTVNLRKGIPDNWIVHFQSPVGSLAHTERGVHVRIVSKSHHNKHHTGSQTFDVSVRRKYFFFFWEKLTHLWLSIPFCSSLTDFYFLIEWFWFYFRNFLLRFIYIPLYFLKLLKFTFRYLNFFQRYSANPP